MIIDGGPVGIGLESTIIDLTEETPMVLRPGFISLEMLRSVLGDVRMDPGLHADDPAFRPPVRHRARSFAGSGPDSLPVASAALVRIHCPDPECEPS